MGTFTRNCFKYTYGCSAEGWKRCSFRVDFRSALYQHARGAFVQLSEQSKYIHKKAATWSLFWENRLPKSFLRYTHQRLYIVCNPLCLQFGFNIFFAVYAYLENGKFRLLVYLRRFFLEICLASVVFINHTRSIGKQWFPFYNHNEYSKNRLPNYDFTCRRWRDGSSYSWA